MSKLTSYIFNISNTIRSIINIEKVLAITIFISSLALPTNFFKVWRTTDSYINGHFVDYLAYKLPVANVLVVLLWIVSLLTAIATWEQPFQRFKFKALRRLWSWMLFLAAVILLRYGWLEPSPLTLSWFFNFWVGPLALLIWYFHWAIPKWQVWLNWSLLMSITLQALVGFWQWCTQSSLAGYWFLGEPDFKVNTLAHSAWSKQVMTLPYGTTPHPNILAGWLMLGVILGLWWARQWKQQVGQQRRLPIWWWLSLILQLLVLAKTESLSAISSLLILLVVLWLQRKIAVRHWRWFGFSSTKFWQKYRTFLLVLVGWLAWIIPLIIPLEKWFSALQTPSYLRRAQLLRFTLNQITQNWEGTTLPALFSSIYTQQASYIGGRFLQPVHNAHLLLITLLGFWTIFVLLTFWIIVYKSYSYFWLSLFLLLPIFNLDHWAISTTSGQFLFILVLCIFSKFNKAI